MRKTTLLTAILLTLTFLVTSTTTQAQFRNEEFVSGALSFDPITKSIGAEVQLNEPGFYLRTGLNVLASGLDQNNTSFIDWGTALGFKVTSYNEVFSVYGGGRMGLVYRTFNWYDLPVDQQGIRNSISTPTKASSIDPRVGLELGVTVKPFFDSGLFFGVRGAVDFRGGDTDNTHYTNWTNYYGLNINNKLNPYSVTFTVGTRF